MMEREEKIQEPQEGVGIRKKAYLGDEFPKSRLFFLVALTIALCTLWPLSVLAPVPLTIGLLLFGNKKTISFSAVAIVGLLAISYFAGKGFQDFIAISSMLGSSLIMSLLVCRFIKAKENPVTGVLKSGAYILGFFLVVSIVGIASSEQSVNEMISPYVEKVFSTIKAGPYYKEITRSGGEEARNLEDFLSKPQDFVTMIVNNLTWVVFVSVYASFWLSALLVLRNSLFWRFKHDYPYSIRDLLHFKVPEKMIFVLITSLVFVVGGEQLHPKFEIIGINLLYCLGVFYFFQGFGVFIDFLNFLRIRGLFKSVIVIFTTLAAREYLAIVGVFDLWVNFRKFFVKKSNSKGDMS